MRVLTVRQPWAWAIIHGGKTVENRVRNIAGKYRGPIAIHVGLTFPFTRDCQAVKSIGGEWPPVIDRWDNVIGAGHIIGVVDLVETHLCSGGCSPWAQGPVDLGCGIRDFWHLALTNPKSLPEPIPYKGALGLRRLDQATIDAIAAQIGEP